MSLLDYAEHERKLKPCPFCGNRRIRILPQPNGFSVDCLECQAKIRVFSAFPGDIVASWNRRLDPEPI